MALTQTVLIIIFLGLCVALMLLAKAGRPCFMAWIGYSILTTAAWWLAPESAAMPVLSLLYPGFFALACAEAAYEVAAGCRIGDLARITVFALAAAYMATLGAASMPTQWNLLPEEAGLQSITAQAYIGLCAAMVATLALLWRFGWTRLAKADWRHAWLMTAMLAVKVSAYALPAEGLTDWHIKTILNFVFMSAVMAGWCFLNRPGSETIPASRDGLLAA